MCVKQERTDVVTADLCVLLWKEKTRYVHAIAVLWLSGQASLCKCNYLKQG